MSVRAVLVAVTAAFALSAAAVPSANAVVNLVGSCTFNGEQTNTPQTCTGAPIYDGTTATVIDTPLNTPLVSLNGTPLITSFNTDGGAIQSNLGFSVNFNTNTWTFTPGPGLLEATLLAVKGGTDWLVLNVTGLLSGSWDTSLLGGGTSHVSFYDHAGVIPIPPAALLFGGALLGLGLLRRRRNATEMAAA